MGRRRAGSATHQYVRWLILAGVLAALAASVVLAIARHNREVSTQVARDEEQSARYESVLRHIANQPPRFEVAYVRLALAEFNGLATDEPSSAYQVVPTEVAKRLRTGQPKLHPNFGAMPHDDYHDAFARAFRNRRVRKIEVSVVALLITQTTPVGGRVRLETERLELRAFKGIWDPLDLTVPKGAEIADVERGLVGSTRRDVVQWTSSEPKSSFLVPLSLIHLFQIPQKPANADLFEATGGLSGWQVTSNIVLSPRRLYVRGPQGEDIELPLDQALSVPFDLDLPGEGE